MDLNKAPSRDFGRDSLERKGLFTTVTNKNEKTKNFGMSSFDVQLERILLRVREGGRAKEDDLNLASDCLREYSRSLQARACEILLRQGPDSVLQAKAVETLVTLCRQYEERGYCAALLLCLSFVPRETLLMHDELRRFTIQCAASPRWPIRVNAIQPLKIYSRLGDQEAEEHLRRALKDENEYVRKNARIELSME